MSAVWSRRKFIARSSTAGLGWACTGKLLAASEVEEIELYVPVRAVTRGPRRHWFGYYDKEQFSRDERWLLGNEVTFEHRSPTAEDEIAVGMVDLCDGDRWIELGRTRAWNWQQGCMLQWRPGHPDEVVWNDREGGQFVVRLHNVRTGRTRTLPAPIYALSPDGRWALAPDFRRLNDCRPGYGYAGVPDPRANLGAPDDTGIWKIDLETGRVDLLLSFADVVRFAPPRGGFPPDAKHWVNHLLVAPDGQRFVFLHRWRTPGMKGWWTRMLSWGADGRDPWLVNATGKVSHFIWRDSRSLLMYAGVPPDGQRWAFLVVEARGDRVDEVDGMMERDGHCTYVPGRANEWIVCDTYPIEPARVQVLYMVHPASRRRWILGRFPSPPEYTGEWRCDLHPRASPSGRWVCIDSAHGDQGRQMWRVDLDELWRVASGSGGLAVAPIPSSPRGRRARTPL
jgi:hypothetical protein